ncbi:MAG: hypothetical protein WC791_03140 [Candidatus Paceibacterota bacterium]|jgi:hypothetical protein
MTFNKVPASAGFNWVTSFNFTLNNNVETLPFFTQKTKQENELFDAVDNSA